VPIAAIRQEGVDDPQAAKEVYARLAGSLREYPIPELKGIQAGLDSIATAKDKNPQAKDVIETSLAEEIKKSGHRQTL
jgi:hypothetical protein